MVHSLGQTSLGQFLSPKAVPLSSCKGSCLLLLPLYLRSSILISLLGFTGNLVIPELWPNNFLVMGKPHTSHRRRLRRPPLPSLPSLPFSTPSPGSSTGSSCVLHNSHWVTSVIASRCGPQETQRGHELILELCATCMDSTTSRRPSLPLSAFPGSHSLGESTEALVFLPPSHTGPAKQLEARRRVRDPGWQESGVPFLPKQSLQAALNSSWREAGQLGAGILKAHYGRGLGRSPGGLG